jgi:hypothetical protein
MCIAGVAKAGAVQLSVVTWHDMELPLDMM